MGGLWMRKNKIFDINPIYYENILDCHLPTVVMSTLHPSFNGPSADRAILQDELNRLRAEESVRSVSPDHAIPAGIMADTHGRIQFLKDAVAGMSDDDMAGVESWEDFVRRFVA